MLIWEVFSAPVNLGIPRLVGSKNSNCTATQKFINIASGVIFLQRHVLETCMYEVLTFVDVTEFLSIILYIYFTTFCPIC